MAYYNAPRQPVSRSAAGSSPRSPRSQAKWMRFAVVASPSLQLQLPLALFSFYGFLLDSTLVRWHVAFGFWKMFTQYSVWFLLLFRCCFQIANMPWNFYGTAKFALCLNACTSEISFGHISTFYSTYSIGPVAARHRPTADLTSCVSFDLLP